MPEDQRFVADEDHRFTPDATASAASRFGGNFIGALNPFPALKHYFVDLPQQEKADFQNKLSGGDYMGAFAGLLKAAPGADFISDTVAAQAHQFVKGYKDLNDTKQQPSLPARLTSAGGRVAAGLLPFVGPAAANAGEQIGSGDVAGGLGSGAGLVAGVVAPGLVKKAVPSPTIKIAPQLDPAEQAAVNFGRANDVPIDAATATGSPAIRNIQGALQNAPGSSGAMKRFRMAQTDALQHVGGQLADQVSAAPTDAETAGATIQDSLTKKAKDLATQKVGAYGALEQIENDPANARAVGSQQVITRAPNGSVTGVQTVPSTAKIAAPVDLGPAKKALAPIRDALMQELPPSQQGYSQALNAINGVLNGPDAIPASAADQTLSAIKRIQRESKNPKTIMLAGKVIGALSPQVDAAVAKMGPAAVRALADGRDFTKAQMAVEDTGESLPAEPVRLVDALTRQRDTGINLLKDVADKTPQSIPAVGRSVIDGLLQKAFSEAGTAKPGTALTEWQKLGDSTKQILFKNQNNPGLIKDLDNFFTLAKKVSENPNPSGSAYVGMLMGDGALLVSAPHLAAGYVIGRSALGRILMSDGGARALTQGFRVPTKQGAVASLAATQILKLAGDDAKPAGGQ